MYRRVGHAVMPISPNYIVFPQKSRQNGTEISEKELRLIMRRSLQYTYYDGGKRKTSQNALDILMRNAYNCVKTVKEVQHARKRDFFSF